MQSVDEKSKLFAHILIEIPFTDGEIISTLLIETNLIIERENDQHVKLDVIIRIALGQAVEILPELQEFLAVIGSKTVRADTAVGIVAVAVGIGKTVICNDIFNPLKRPILAERTEGFKHILEQRIFIVEDHFIAGNVHAHVSAAAEKIHKAVDIRREMGQELGEKLEFSTRIIQGRLDQRFLSAVIAFANEKSFLVALDVRFACIERLILRRKELHLPFSR